MGQMTNICTKAYNLLNMVTTTTKMAISHIPWLSWWLSGRRRNCSGREDDAEEWGVTDGTTNSAAAVDIVDVDTDGTHLCWNV